MRIFNKENDYSETDQFLKSDEDFAHLFDFLNGKKEIDQKTLLNYFKKKENNYRWNYVEDKKYPCNETHSLIATRLNKVNNLPAAFLTKEREEALWHIIYSVTDKIDYEKALKSFAVKNGIDIASFLEAFRRFPPFPSSYGAYSIKAIRKLLPLMRCGKYWSEMVIDAKTTDRIGKILSAEYNESIQERVRNKAINLTEINHFQRLPEWLAKYVVYDRHAESADIGKWRTITDIEEYLRSFRQHSLKNPIVEQILLETLRVVKDIWEYYGKGAENFFNEIHIELGREMKNPKSEREKISKQNTIKENTNLRIKAMLAEMLHDSNVENVKPFSPMQQDILKIYEDGVLSSDIEIPEDIEKISKQAQPTSSELQRYKLWLEQKYLSPYTGQIIPLNKLFTPAYEIEHIIPQSRYYDDSFSNKVICEAAINTLKGNQTGLQFIQNHHGQIVELGMGKTACILSEDDYNTFVKRHYENSRSKKNKLLALDIPEKMIERQMNDTRYISRFVMQLLSNIVRGEKNDDGVNSKNVLACNGQITSKLKQDWGIDAVWNVLILQRFERLNTLTNTTQFTVYNERHQKYLPAVPLELQKGFQKKRIDHRHHAMDALVIACATRNHMNYLNNQHALDKNKSANDKQKNRFDLKKLLCDKKYNSTSKEDYSWVFKQPWNTFIPDAKENLEKVIVSFKQNLRIINKTVNYYEKIVDGAKVKIKQSKGQSWAIRKSLHTPMPYSKKKYDFDTLKISDNLSKVDLIIDASIKEKAKAVLMDFQHKVGKAQNFLKTTPLKDSDGKEIVMTTFMMASDKFRRRQPISKLSNRGQGGIKTTDDAIKFINKIADRNLQNELLLHLKSNENDINKAFSPEGIERFNSTRKMPVYNLPIAEAGFGRFPVGENYYTKHKQVEADTGTNLFFAIYVNEGKRNFETIALNEVIIHQRWRATLPIEEQKTTSLIPINPDKGLFLFYLSPYDLVYIPTNEENDNLNTLTIQSLDKESASRVYKLVSCTGNEAHFVPHFYSKEIIKNEMGTNNKSQNSLDGTQIKMHCIKLQIDRLGNINRGKSSRPLLPLLH